LDACSGKAAKDKAYKGKATKAAAAAKGKAAKAAAAAKGKAAKGKAAKGKAANAAAAAKGNAGIEESDDNTELLVRLQVFVVFQIKAGEVPNFKPESLSVNVFAPRTATLLEFKERIIDAVNDASKRLNNPSTVGKSRPPLPLPLHFADVAHSHAALAPAWPWEAAKRNHLRAP